MPVRFRRRRCSTIFSGSPIERPVRGYQFADLARAYRAKPWDRDLEEALARRVNERTRSATRGAIRASRLSSSAELVLALCKLGHADDFAFLMHRLERGPIIEFSDYTYLARQIAALAPRDVKPEITRHLSSPEFWQTWGVSERPADRLPVVQYDNLHIYRRILGLAFGRLANRRDWSVLVRMLSHNYWTVRRAAADALGRLARPDDLDRLVDSVLAIDSDRDEGLRLLVSLDLRLNAKDLVAAGQPPPNE
jgi:HEAT repeat